MCSEKRQQVIESVKNMTDREADILAVFVAGFRAGRQTAEREVGNQMHYKSAERTA